MTDRPVALPPYHRSIAGILLSTREAVMAPIRPILRDVDLTEQQWRVLRVLAKETALDARGLAAAALLQAPSVTRILRELHNRGLIARGEDQADARRSVIAITDAGRELLDSTARHTIAILDEYSARFGATRLQALLSELAAFRSAVEETAEQVAARHSDTHTVLSSR